MFRSLACSFCLLISASLSDAQTLACLNDYIPNYITDHKAVRKSQSIVDSLQKVDLIEPWKVRRGRLRKEVENGGDYKVKNDYAGALMHTGDPKAAIEILTGIEETNPGLYRTASNLGTAYELAGDPVKALEWIRKGIERNPVSHEASEWIHVRILEAKAAPETDNPRSILGMDFGNENLPKKPGKLPVGNTGGPLTLDQIEAGLTHQLHERLQFVKAPDEIVAMLLFDLGNIIALKSDGIGMAQAVYELADEFAGTGAKPGVRALITDRRSMAMAGNQTRIIGMQESLARVFLFVVCPLGVVIIRRLRRRI